jgi:hypothetical protein
VQPDGRERGKETLRSINNQLEVASDQSPVLSKWRAGRTSFHNLATDNWPLFFEFGAGSGVGYNANYTQKLGPIFKGEGKSL